MPSPLNKIPFHLCENEKGQRLELYSLPCENFYRAAVLPSESKAVCEFAFDLEQLKDLFKAIEKQEKYAKKGCATVKFYDDKSPMIVKHGLNGMGNINVLMPLKMG